MDGRIFHIAIVDDWDGAQRFGEYEGSTLGETLEEVGYIHATTAEHVEDVLTAVYRDVNFPVVVVVVDTEALSAAGVDVQWVDTHRSSAAIAEPTPRIMGALPLDPEVVIATIALESQDGQWTVPDMSGYGLDGSTA